MNRLSSLPAKKKRCLLRSPRCPCRGEVQRIYRETAHHELWFAIQFDKNELLPAPPPPDFSPLRDKVGAWLKIPATEFVHALITEYEPGTALGWHRDVPNFAVVVGVSLGGSCRIRFRPFPWDKRKKESVFALDLEPRSAYTLQGEVRWRWQHSIPTTKQHRYSITFRTLAAGDK